MPYIWFKANDTGPMPHQYFHRQPIKILRKLGSPICNGKSRHGRSSFYFNTYLSHTGMIDKANIYLLHKNFLYDTN
jgi:hypothetical protein